MANILKRWEYLVELLRRQLNGEVDPKVINSTRDRVKRFAFDIDQRVTPLTKPGFDDSAFEGIRFGRPGPTVKKQLKMSEGRFLALRNDSMQLDKVQMPHLTDLRQVGMALLELERLYISARRRAKSYKLVIDKVRLQRGIMMAAQAEGREYVGRGRTRLKVEPLPCFDGCGGMATIYRDGLGNPRKIHRFIRGHLIRYIKMISTVERGYDRWEDLPELMKERLPWGKCLKCGGKIPLVDPFGHDLKPEERIGISCWRERLKVRWPYSPDKYIKVPKVNKKLVAALNE